MITTMKISKAKLKQIIKEEIQEMQMYLPGMGGGDTDADPNALAASAFQYLDRKLDQDPTFSIGDLDEKFFKLLSNLYLQSGSGATGGPSDRQIEKEIRRFMSLDSEARKESIKYKLGS